MATNIRLKSSTQTGKTPTLSDLSLRELAVNTTDGKLFLRRGDGSASDRIVEVTAPLTAKEPAGIEDITQSSISFNDATRTFSITPVNASFNVWCKGIKYNFTSTQSVQIPTTSGLYYIYFNADGVLSHRSTVFDWENDTPVAYVYWNSADATAYFVADERHGITMDWATHEYLHRTRGAVIANGFSISNFTTSGTGASNADAQFDLGNGTFFDEDLEVNITHSNSPTPNTWQQDLQGPSRIPVFYLSGTVWKRDTVTDYAFKQGTSRIQYNVLNAGTWSTQEVPTNTWYTSSWIIATNNINYPVIAVIGQSAHNKISDEEQKSFSDLLLPDFPIVEFRPLWKIIWQTDSRYANTPKARIANVLDIRQLSSAGIGGIAVSDHGLLTGLADDDHLQYVHISENRTISASHTISGTLTITNTSNTALTVAGRLGVGNANPDYKLDVNGDINFTGVLRKNGEEYVSGIGALKDGVSVTSAGNTLINFTGTAVTAVSAASGTITAQIDKAAFTRSTISFTATAGQTTFNVSYTVGFIDVFLNGVRLNSTEYTATNGTTVVLTDAAFADDIIDVVKFENTGAFAPSYWYPDQTGTHIYRLPDTKVSIGSSIITSTLAINNVLGFDTSITTVNTTFATTIDSMPVATYRSAKYQVQITQGTDYQISDVLVVHDGTNAGIIEYGSIATNDYLGTFTAIINGGNVLVQVTMISPAAATVKVARQSITL
jgi:hypothetical protein